MNNLKMLLKKIHPIIITLLIIFLLCMLFFSMFRHFELKRANIEKRANAIASVLSNIEGVAQDYENIAYINKNGAIKIAQTYFQDASRKLEYLDMNINFIGSYIDPSINIIPSFRALDNILQVGYNDGSIKIEGLLSDSIITEAEKLFLLTLAKDLRQIVSENNTGSVENPANDYVHDYTELLNIASNTNADEFCSSISEFDKKYSVYSNSNSLSLKEKE